MKTTVKKQTNTELTRINKDILDRIREKAEKEQRAIIVVLNRIVNSGLKHEQEEVRK